MGKKKKGVKAQSKQKRKQELQQRRDRQQEDRPQEFPPWMPQPSFTSNEPTRGEQVRNGPASREQEQYAVGDRVYTKTLDGETSTHRAVIKEVFDETCSVLLIDGPDTKDNWTTLFKDDFILDPYTLTFPFDVGDSVAIVQDNEWKPAIVRHIYPPALHSPGKETAPFYQLSLEGEEVYFNTPGETQYRGIPVTADHLIKRRLSTFRFKPGDRVLVSAEKARGLAAPSRSLWVPCQVTSVDKVCGDHIYKCAFHDTHCYVDQDTDEYIAGADTTPRQRLLDAIRQNCSYRHLVHLVESSSLDVTSFRDLLLEEAIQAANYGALLMLEVLAKLDLSTVTDSTGGGLLHGIANSPHAERFFETAAQFERNEDSTTLPSISLDGGSYEICDEKRSLLRRKDRDGRIFLFYIIQSGNLRALEFILSEHIGMPVVMSRLKPSFEPLEDSWRDNEGVSFRDFARLHEQWEMICIFDAFDTYSVYHKLAECIFEGNDSNWCNIAKSAAVIGVNVDVLARRFYAYHDMFQYNIEQILCNNALVGNSSVVRWLIEAVPELLGAKLARDVSISQNLEYGLLQNPKDSFRTYEPLNLVSHAMLGRRLLCSTIWKGSPKAYGDFLVKIHAWIIRGQNVDFVKALVEEIDLLRDDPVKDYFRDKITLLVDDEDLSGRLSVLEYLVKEKSQDPPCVLDVIEWKQTGVLRWLIDRMFLDLGEPSFCSKQLAGRVKNDMQFLDKTKVSKLPRDLAVSSFLLFACIEYDDLRSFLWILEATKVNIGEVKLLGWNLAHACAYFGRQEIFLSLLQGGIISKIIVEVCQRKPWRGFHCAHMALSQGFTALADFMLASGCPSKTLEGKDVYELAKSSKHAHVREWGVSREKPALLGKDIAELLRLLEVGPDSSQSVREHIKATNCLDYSRWITGCNYDFVDQKGPVGLSYSNILERLCEVGDPDLPVWLVEQLSPGMEHDFNSFEVISFKKFWKSPSKRRIIEEVDLRPIIERSDSDGFFSSLLGLPAMSGVSTEDPLGRNPLLDYMLHHFKGKPYICEQLDHFKVKLVKVAVLYEAINILQMFMMVNILLLGAPVEEAEEIACIFHAAMVLFKEITSGASVSSEVLRVFWHDGMKISIDANVGFAIDKKTHPLYKQLLWCNPRHDCGFLYLVLAAEGHHNLITWTLLPSRNTWTLENELSSTRVAAFMGHDQVVNVFLQDQNPDITFKSTLSARWKAALLGAAEGGRLQDMIDYSSSIDCVAGLDFNEVADRCYLNKNAIKEDKKGNEYSVYSVLEDLSCTFVGSAVAGFLLDECRSLTLQENPHLEVIKWVVDNTNTTATSVVLSALQLLDILGLSPLKSYEMLSFSVESLGFDIWGNHALAGEFVEHTLRRLKCLSFEQRSQHEYCLGLKKLFDFAVIHGIDLQGFAIHSRTEVWYDELSNLLDVAQEDQRLAWSRFDILRTGATVSSIQAAVESGELTVSLRDRGGLLLTHLAAAYDRQDLLEWLITDMSMSLDEKDAQGRSVCEVARASGAVSVMQWISIQEASLTVSRIISSNFRRRKTRRSFVRFLSSLQRLQARYRGGKVRRSNRHLLLQRLKLSSRFRSIWRLEVLDLNKKEKSQWLTWFRLKISGGDVARSEEILADLAQASASVDKLGQTLQASLSFGTEEAVDEAEVGPTFDDSVQHGPLEKDSETTIAVAERLNGLDRIHFTKDVVKWLRVSDPKYREFFHRRIEQLAAGDRSRILAKGLTGSKTRIFETYLEQKSGFRILWTLMPSGVLRIWYVAKHDDVSRLISLIDDAEKRSSRQLVTALEMGDSDCSPVGASSEVMLDPFGNTPMKLYEVTFDNVGRLLEESWTPPLFLTREEREIVETPGTVLVLGRSGTGKTVCICNRMDYDWRRWELDPTFTQLFVSRSLKLRNHVKQTVEGFVGAQPERRKFLTFPLLVRALEKELRGKGLCGAALPSYVSSQKMTFQRFKSEVYSSEDSSVGALVAWKSIRAFLKGSAESLLYQGGLPESSFLALGVRQCRLSPEQRKDVYRIFEKYKAYMSEKKLWDECDRIRVLVEALQKVFAANIDEFNSIREKKIYVDEIQDYTQVEILLFFVLSGPESLFLAGDPAQSVVDGANFRFKDIRSVGYHLFGEERKALVPDKPKTVNLNFRSHSGILNVAAAVLNCLFSSFPDSAEHLRRDRGLFQGPRPGLLYKVNSDHLYELSQKVEGITFLTHDEHVPQLRRSMGQYPLIFGIREAKGLEWQSVVIVDFFSGLPKTYQKAWRELLLGRDVIDLKHQFPEMESHLKLLYTGVTRCMQRLFFAEQNASIAGEAFVRWLTTTTISAWNRTECLAVKQRVDDVEAMVRTLDEWRSAGLDNAIMAEQETVEAEEAIKWLEKALYCFGKSGDISLSQRARTHLASVQFQAEFEEKLQSGLAEADVGQVEMDVADLVERLLSEGLALEVRRLLILVMPALNPYSQEQLQFQLMDKLPTYEELEELSDGN